jgi:hypothetical protein
LLVQTFCWKKTVHPPTLPHPPLHEERVDQVRKKVNFLFMQKIGLGVTYVLKEGLPPDIYIFGILIMSKLANERF